MGGEAGGDGAAGRVVAMGREREGEREVEEDQARWGPHRIICVGGGLALEHL